MKEWSGNAGSLGLGEAVEVAARDGSSLVALNGVTGWPTFIGHLHAGHSVKLFPCVISLKPPLSLRNPTFQTRKLRPGEAIQLESGAYSPGSESCGVRCRGFFWGGHLCVCHLVSFLMPPPLKAPSGRRGMPTWPLSHRRWLSHPIDLEGGTPGSFSPSCSTSRMFPSPVPLAPSQPRADSSFLLARPWKSSGRPLLWQQD